MAEMLTAKTKNSLFMNFRKLQSNFENIVKKTAAYPRR